MTAYTSVKGAKPSTQNTRTLATGSIPVVDTFTMSTAFALNDTIGCMFVPAGSVITSVTAAPDSFDSGTAATFSVGDALVPARFITGATVGRGGGIQSGNVASGIGYPYASATQILVTITAAPGTAVTGGTFRLIVHYTPDA